MEPGEYKVLFAQEEKFWWYRGLRRLIEEQAAAYLPAAGGAEPWRILDAGCGTGGMQARLARRGWVCGIDASAIALRFAAERRAGPLCRGSVVSLPYSSQSFHLIVSLDVLYHRGVDDDLQALREFRRCLRPGGILLLNLPAYDRLRSRHDSAVHTARRYRRAKLRALLSSAGLEPVRVTYWNTLLFPGSPECACSAPPRHAALATAAANPPANEAAAKATESAGKSDVGDLPGPVNAALESILTLERHLLRRWDLPFGLSLLAVARRTMRAR